MITAAKPKIADYPFTTLIPNLGVLYIREKAVRVADIPGIIEGAHRGHGLGLSFLQHIERVKAILYMIDITGDDLAYNLKLLRDELRTYNEKLLQRPYHVLLTKSDLVSEEEKNEIVRTLEGEPVLSISSIGGHNMDSLLAVIESLMDGKHAS